MFLIQQLIFISTAFADKKSVQLEAHLLRITSHNGEVLDFKNFFQSQCLLLALIEMHNSGQASKTSFPFIATKILDMSSLAVGETMVALSICKFVDL